MNASDSREAVPFPIAIISILYLSINSNTFFFDSSILLWGSVGYITAISKGFPVLSKGFEIETEMTIHAVDKNFKLVEVPVAYRDRPEGSVSKLNTYKDGFRVLKTIATLFKEYKPGFFFGIVGVLSLIVSLLLGVPVVIEYMKTGVVPRFPSLIVSGVFLIITLLLWITGILLQVIVKKHKQLYELYLNSLSKNK